MLVSKLILFDYHTNLSETNVSLNSHILLSRELPETVSLIPKDIQSNYEKLQSLDSIQNKLESEYLKLIEKQNELEQWV